MKLRRLLTSAMLAVTLAVVPATANAAALRTYAYGVSGVEVRATSTEGVFAGTLAGSGATGTWYAEVEHTPLGASATITGGRFGMLLTGASPAHTVTGRFAGDSVTRIGAGTNCTRQVYTVTGRLDPVAAGSAVGTGTFDVLLTHHRTRILGRCVTYAATVGGALSLTVPA